MSDKDMGPWTWIDKLSRRTCDFATEQGDASVWQTAEEWGKRLAAWLLEHGDEDGGQRDAP